MPDHVDDLLHAEAERFAATLRPHPVHEIRARGDRRRRRAAAVTAALTLTVLAGSGAVAYALAGSPGHGPAPVGPRRLSPSATSRPSPTITHKVQTGTTIPARQLNAVPHIVAVSPAGALQVVDVARELTLRTLVPGGVFADEISVSPDGRTVYYAARHGCGAEIYSVPVAGGPPVPIAAGVQPAISPDGTRLAFAREPFTSGGGPAYQTCGPRSPVSLVVKDLATGTETSYPGPPGANGPLVFSISHLSWSPDGSRLAVSLGEVQDNNGWGLVILDPASARYYMPSITPGQGQVPVQGGPGGYYREGVFLPSGLLLVNRVCCAGVPVRTTSSLVEEVTTSGGFVRQLAIGFDNRDHTSFDVYGQWVLYLSGTDLYVSQNGQRPEPIALGLEAAAWIPRNR